MKKQQEDCLLTSTWRKAREDETLFILRGQDQSSPEIILQWIIRNMHCSDEKLREAFECALDMKRESLKAAD